MKPININSNTKVQLSIPKSALKSTKRGYHSNSPLTYDLNKLDHIDSENYELHDYPEKPAEKPLYSQLNLPPVKHSHIYENFELDPDIGNLGNINYEYIPESPPLLTDDCDMDLSPFLVDTTKPSYDCEPFRRCYNYEYRIDDGGIITSMIRDTIDGKKLIFPQELEYQESLKYITTWDNILFYLFGIDKRGHFGLAEKRKAFYAFPWTSMSQPLEYSNDIDNIIDGDSLGYQELQEIGEYFNPCDKEENVEFDTCLNFHYDV